MDKRADEIAARVEAATKSPWQEQLTVTGVRVAALEQRSSGGRSRAVCYLPAANVREWHEGKTRVIQQTQLPQAEANAAFIANAREDIPYLLARVLDLETDNAKLNKRVEYLQEELGPIGGDDGHGDKKDC